MPMKFFYWYLLAQPHTHKFGSERVLAYADGTLWADDGYRPDVLPKGWESAEGMPMRGELEHVLVVRPAFLTDGPATGDQEPGTKRKMYKVCADEKGSEGWTVSRKDVAHFVVERALQEWD